MADSRPRVTASGLDRAGEGVKPVSFNVVLRKPVDSDVIRICSLRDDIFLLCVTPDKKASIKILDRNDDLSIIKTIVPLPGYVPLDMIGCRGSTALYVLNQDSQCRSVIRVSKRSDGTFEVLPWLSGLGQSFSEMKLYESFQAGFILHSHRSEPDPSLLTRYNAKGVLINEVVLFPEKLGFVGIVFVMEKSNGNLILATYCRLYDYVVEIKEIDFSGNLIKQYRSCIFGDAGVCFADTDERIVIVGKENEVELLDAELNCTFAVRQETRQELIGYGIHLNRDRKEIVRLFDIGAGKPMKVLLIFNFS